MNDVVETSRGVGSGRREWLPPSGRRRRCCCPNLATAVTRAIRVAGVHTARDVVVGHVHEVDSQHLANRRLNPVEIAACPERWVLRTARAPLVPCNRGRRRLPCRLRCTCRGLPRSWADHCNRFDGGRSCFQIGWKATEWQRRNVSARAVRWMVCVAIPKTFRKKSDGVGHVTWSWLGWLGPVTPRRRHCRAIPIAVGLVTSFADTPACEKLEASTPLPRGLRCQQLAGSGWR